MPPWAIIFYDAYNTSSNFPGQSWTHNMVSCGAELTFNKIMSD